MQSTWQSIPPMHNTTNQLLSSPNAAKMQPTAWVQCSIEPSKSLARTNMSVLPSRIKSTYSMPLQPLVSCWHTTLGLTDTTSANMTNAKQASLSWDPPHSKLGSQMRHKQRQIRHPLPLSKTICTIKTSRHIPGLPHISDEHGKNIRQWHGLSLHEGGCQCIQGRGRPHNMQRGTNPHWHLR